MIEREKSTALDAVSAEDLGRLSRLLHRDLRRRGVDAGTADDLVQEAWLRTLRSEHRPRGARLGPWLSVVGRHLVFELRRANGHRTLRERAAARPERALAPEPEAHEARAVRLLHELPEPYRSVLELHFLEEQSVHEIARALDRSPGTVRSQLVRGLERLRARLAPDEKERSQAEHSLLAWLARVFAAAFVVRTWWRWSAALVAVLGVVWFAWRTSEERRAPVLLAAGVAEALEVAPETPARAPLAVDARDAQSAPVLAAPQSVARSRRVEGTVRAPDGTPIPGAQVWYGPRTGDGTPVAVSDALGRYAVASVDPKRFLWATHDAWAPAHRVYAATIAPEAEHDLCLSAARGRVELHVLTPERLPAPGVRIAFDSEPGSERSDTTSTGALELAAHFALSATTDERGVVALAVPDLAVTEFEARRDGHLVQRGEFEFAADAASVELVLPRAPELRGLVLDPDGRPAAGAAIEVHQFDELLAKTVTDAAGRFAAAGLAPGEFSLTACVADGSTATTARGTLADGDRQSLRLETTPRGLILGHAFAGERPLAGALVTLYRSGLPGQPDLGTTHTDASGAFVFVARDDFDLRLELTLPGDDFPCAMAENARIGEEVALRVQPELRALEALTLEFVSDEAGRLPSLVDLRCWRPRIGRELPVDPRTGRVTFQLPRGKYELNAWVPGIGFWHARKHLETSARVQRVLLPRPGEVEVALVLPPGTDAFEVALEMGGFNPFGFEVRGAFSHSRALQLDADRRHLHALLFPGKYDYCFRAPGFADETGALDLGEGELRRVELAPVRGARVHLVVDFPSSAGTIEGVQISAHGPFGERAVPVRDARTTDMEIAFDVRLPIGTREVSASTKRGLVGSVSVPDGFLAPERDAGRLRIELHEER